MSKNINLKNNFKEELKLKPENKYSEYLQREREKIKKGISEALESCDLKLTQLQITDDGYVVDAAITQYMDEDLLLTELCRRVENLEFDGYMIVDTMFLSWKVSMVLAPITEASMDDFAWNYIMCYLPFENEVKSLALSMGVLERIIEPLGDSVRAEYDKMVDAL